MLVKDYPLSHYGADDSLINIISNHLLTPGPGYGLIASVNTTRQQPDSEDAWSSRLSRQPDKSYEQQADDKKLKQTLGKMYRINVVCTTSTRNKGESQH